MSGGYPPRVLREVERLAAAAAGAEGCGVVVRRGSGELEALPLANASPQPRTGFELDPATLLRLLRALEAEGGALAAVFHAHLDAPAELSPKDREAAALWPGVEQLVVEVRGGRPVRVRRYRAGADGWAEQPA